MTGREKFSKFEKIISILVSCSKIIPTSILNWIYNRNIHRKGKYFTLQRYIYVKRFSKKCGSNVYIGPNVTIKNINQLVLGSNVSIHDFSYLECSGGLEIGNEVSIANSTSIVTEEHNYNDLNLPIKYQGITKKSINIANDVWIGSGVRILGGVVIESGCVVGAGSVLKGSFENNSIVVGVPGRTIRKRGE